jgi:hypothetical protein
MPPDTKSQSWGETMRKVNWTAVIVASIVHFIGAAVWFTVLADPWLAGIGKTKESMMQQTGGALVFYPYIVAFLCNIVMARVLAQVILATSRNPTLWHGLRVAFYAWGGFVATAFLTEYVFELRSVSIYLITVGYPLIGMLIMGGILGAWQKKESAAMSAKA